MYKNDTLADKIVLVCSLFMVPVLIALAFLI
jgi:hypothetical protein